MEDSQETQVSGARGASPDVEEIVRVAYRRYKRRLNDYEAAIKALQAAVTLRLGIEDLSVPEWEVSQQTFAQYQALKAKLDSVRQQLLPIEQELNRKNEECDTESPQITHILQSEMKPSHHTYRRCLSIITALDGSIDAIGNLDNGNFKRLLFNHELEVAREAYRKLEESFRSLQTKLNSTEESLEVLRRENSQIVSEKVKILEESSQQKDERIAELEKKVSALQEKVQESESKRTIALEDSLKTIRERDVANEQLRLLGDAKAKSMENIAALEASTATLDEKLRNKISELNNANNKAQEQSQNIQNLEEQLKVFGVHDETPISVTRKLIQQLTPSLSASSQSLDQLVKLLEATPVYNGPVENVEGRVWRIRKSGENDHNTYERTLLPTTNLFNLCTHLYLLLHNGIGADMNHLIFDILMAISKKIEGCTDPFIPHIIASCIEILVGENPAPGTESALKCIAFIEILRLLRDRLKNWRLPVFQEEGLRRIISQSEPLYETIVNVSHCSDEEVTTALDDSARFGVVKYSDNVLFGLIRNSDDITMIDTTLRTVDIISKSLVVRDREASTITNDVYIIKRRALPPLRIEFSFISQPHMQEFFFYANIPARQDRAFISDLLESIAARALLRED